MVLIIVGDDIGYGHHGAFERPGAYADLPAVGQGGLKYTNVAAASHGRLWPSAALHLGKKKGAVSSAFPSGRTWD